MSKAYTTADPKGETLYTLGLCSLRSATPAPIDRLSLLASSVEQAGQWIIAQSFPAFAGWKVDRVREPAKDPGFVILKSPRGNTYKIEVTARPLHPPKIKTFEQMSVDEKLAALAAAVRAKEDIKTNGGFATWQR